MAGVQERLHGHDWQVTVTVEGEDLDEDGLLCDFHALERVLDGILKPYCNGNLNDEAPFTRVNPTAENLAKHIATTLADQLSGPGRVHSVRVTEAPECAATYVL